MAVRTLGEARRLAVDEGVLENDPWIYRIVVAFLGFVILLGMAGALYLAGTGREAPQVIVALGSGAIGALTGVLAPTPTRRR